MVERPLDGAEHPHVLAFELELQRHLKEPRGARIARVAPIAGVGSSPMSSRYTASANDSRPIISSSGKPRMRILFGAIEVSAVCHRSDGVRACVRRSFSEAVRCAIYSSHLTRS